MLLELPLAPAPTKRDIRKLAPDDLKAFLVEHGEKPFRAKQVQEWLWKNTATTFEEMNNLSLSHPRVAGRALRDKRRDGAGAAAEQRRHHQIGVSAARRQRGRGRAHPARHPHDGLHQQPGGLFADLQVLRHRLHGPQAQPRRGRDLRPGGADSGAVRGQYGTPLTNIVYMGMGEPLLNYANVVESVRRITAPDGLNMAPRRITISTAGIAKMIKKLADDDVKANLALSLHAPTDAKRNEIMPINEANSLAALKEALQYYHEKTGRKVTYEYIVFENFNDGLEDAAELLKISKWLPCKVNLIEYNPIENADYQNAEADKILAFHKFLADRGCKPTSAAAGAKTLTRPAGSWRARRKKRRSNTTCNGLGVGSLFLPYPSQLGRGRFHRFTFFFSPMKRKFLAALLLLAGTAQAQNNALKIDIFQPVLNTAALSFEHKLSDASSFQLGLSGTFNYTGDGAYYNGGSIGGLHTSGFAITPEYRLYLSEKHVALQGFYVAPYLRFQHLQQRGDYQYFSIEPPIGYSNAQEYQSRFNAFGLGVVVGRHWIFKQRFSLDAFAGPGYNFISTSSNVPGYEPVKSDFLAYPNTNNNYDFRAGVTFGIAF